MSGPLQRVRLPLEAQAWAKKLDLVRWVNKVAWQTEARFKMIDRVREIWTIAGHVDFGDDPEAIVRGAYQYFREDGEFTKYVLDDCGQDMTEVGAWSAAVTAYTWVVLQRYTKELGGGA